MASSPTDVVTDATGELRPIRIEAVEGPGKGACAVLAQGTCVIGSAPGSDLTLADNAVSRRHAVVELLPGGVRVQDAGSRNGVRYLNARIQDARVPIGGTVGVGRTVVAFSWADGTPVEEAEPPPGLVGRSRAMRQLFAQLRRLAAVDTPVLAQGETGVGKEALLRGLHALSPRSRQPFTVLDCASINAQLVESELFGHVKGAFTGAVRDRVGAFVLAGEGTLLLDGVDELMLELQPKLLRVLERREVTPVGGRGVTAIRCRVVATCRRDLRHEAEAGRFRSDLYYRVAAATLLIPPLRERPEDVPQLLAQAVEEARAMQVPLAPMTLAAFQCDPWPGNVRELRNAVVRALTLGSDPVPDAVRSAPPASFFEARERALERFERDFVAALLEKCRRNVSLAAREARLSRRQFYRLLTRHKLVPRPRAPR
jgi:DNA-binding NtrC family response regulator